ncbi:unnamed protein product [Chondrus crispus]|uniref:Uncharacterized protein n=1 Tax=Chondrus crispus TaxID=2769 RepID=R7QPY6_CHOCR|nr:unnamed protein product [Chondrus crispus]CDF39843.1 unnamed protein product [Chondrus crispus]|eukprot:XP_005710137.1 unnamed protein product [Chondrus crispus]
MSKINIELSNEQSTSYKWYDREIRVGIIPDSGTGLSVSIR